VNCGSNSRTLIISTVVNSIYIEKTTGEKGV
jgi:hypothetical protein